MKKFLSLALAVLVVLSLSVTAFAAYADPSEVHSGGTCTISSDEFLLDGTGASLGGELYKEYYVISKVISKNGSYISRVYFEEGSSEVTIVFKPGLDISGDKEILGTLRLRDRTANKTWICTLESGDLTLTAGEVTRVDSDGDRQFSLPSDYQYNRVKFVDVNGDNYGTFTADFTDDSGHNIAYFKTKVVEQSPLFLGYNTTENLTLMKKYADATLRFVNWDAKPTFDIKGKLGIYMDSDEFIYGLKTDGTLYRLGGTYSTSTGAYVLDTATLGSYVISDRALSATGTGTAASSSSSTAPKPSSSSTAPKPSSSSVAPAPSSSTPAPSSSSSSAAPESSSSSSSEPIPESSSVESLPESSSTPVDTKPEDTEKGGFPLIPVLLGTLAVVVIVLVVVLFGTGKGGKKAKKKDFKDWDD